MPRVDIPVQRIPNGGSIADVAAGGVAGDAANDHDMVNDGQTELWFFNEGAGTVVAILKSVADANGRLGDITITVLAGSFAVAGPFSPRNIWNTSGKLEVDIDTDVSLTIAGVNRTTRK